MYTCFNLLSASAAFNLFCAAKERGEGELQHPKKKGSPEKCILLPPPGRKESAPSPKELQEDTHTPHLLDVSVCGFPHVVELHDAGQGLPGQLEEREGGWLEKDALPHEREGNER